MPFGNYFARRPEVNSGLLHHGPGPGPMLTAAAGYQKIANTLNRLAEQSDSHMSQLSETWRGDAADRARGAFENNAAWMRQQAQAAGAEAAKATSMAHAFTAAKSSAALPAAIAANRTLHAILLPWSWKPWVAATLRVLDGMYMGMWVQSALALTGYDAASIPNIGPADNTTAAAVTNDGSTPTPAPSSGPTPTDAGGAGTGGAGGGGTNSGTALPSQSNIGSGDMAGAGDGVGVGGGPSGFFDTQPTSPTLSELSGGPGSAVPFGVYGGGVGVMPGTATGFRMPSNWATGGPGRAFGGPVGPGAGSPAATSGAPAGAIPPRGSARRRRERDGRRTGDQTVFAPDTEREVPDPDTDLAVGVVEYVDEDAETTQRPAAADGLRGAS